MKVKIKIIQKILMRVLIKTCYTWKEKSLSYRLMKACKYYRNTFFQS